jgi:hypothetical protein
MVLLLSVYGLRLVPKLLKPLALTLVTSADFSRPVFSYCWGQRGGVEGTYASVFDCKRLLNFIYSDRNEGVCDPPQNEVI